jgi:lipopolysaccharide transport system permease protein
MANQESQIQHPVQLLKSMWFDLLASRELAWRLLVRDISAQYRQSFLGIFWAFVPPIVTALGLLLTWVMYRLAMPFIVERMSS